MEQQRWRAKEVVRGCGCWLRLTRRELAWMVSIRLTKIWVDWACRTEATSLMLVSSWPYERPAARPNASDRGKRGTHDDIRDAR